MHSVPAPLRLRLFRGSEVISGRLLTRRQLQSGAYVRVALDIYADAALELDHRLRCVGVALTMPAQAYLTADSAAWFHGVTTARPARRPVVAIPPLVRWRSSAAALIRTATPAAIADVSVAGLVHGTKTSIRLATPTQAAADALQHLTTIEACVLVDALLATAQTNAPELVRYLDSLRGVPVARALQSLALCDRRAESPEETRLRVTLVQAGLPTPVPQHVVRTEDGTFVARVDLAWPRLRLAVEYDGRWHADPEQLARDRRRLNALVAAGWTVVHVTAEMMRDPVAVIAEIATAIARAGG